MIAPIYTRRRPSCSRMLQDMGYDVKMMGCDGMDGILGVEGLRHFSCRGLPLMNYSPPTTRTPDFESTLYKDKHGIPTFDQFAADAYDGVRAVARPSGSGRSWCRRGPDRGSREAAWAMPSRLPLTV